MRHRILISACLAILLLASASHAQVDPVKYAQPPKVDDSFSFASSYAVQGFVTADDWVCPDGIPILGITWWGSYWLPSAGQPLSYSDWRPDASPGGIQSWTITIFSNLPATDPLNAYGFSHPDAALWTGEFSAANEAHGFVSVIDVPGGTTINRNVYRYNVSFADAISETPPTFDQQQGEIYWLSIVANMADDSKQWGWHESSARVGAYAVQAGVPFCPEMGYDWYIPCTGHDMAFELIPIPEPGSLLVFSIGASRLVGFVIRRRR